MAFLYNISFTVKQNNENEIKTTPTRKSQRPACRFSSHASLIRFSKNVSLTNLKPALDKGVKKIFMNYCPALFK